MVTTARNPGRVRRHDGAAMALNEIITSAAAPETTAAATKSPLDVSAAHVALAPMTTAVAIRRNEATMNTMAASWPWRRLLLSMLWLYGPATPLASCADGAMNAGQSTDQRSAAR